MKMATIAPVLALVLCGCTMIERVNVNTAAVNCNVERGDDKSAAGQGEANVLSQSGAAAAQFVGSLRSIITCSDGTTAHTWVDGSDTEVSP